MVGAGWKTAVVYSKSSGKFAQLPTLIASIRQGRFDKSAVFCAGKSSEEKAMDARQVPSNGDVLAARGEEDCLAANFEWIAAARFSRRVARI